MKRVLSKKFLISMILVIAIFLLFSIFAIASGNDIFSVKEWAKTLTKLELDDEIVAMVGEQKISKNTLEKKLLNYEAEKSSIQQQLETASDSEVIKALKERLEEFNCTDIELREKALSDLINRALIVEYCSRKKIIVENNEVDKMYDEQQELLKIGIENGEESAIKTETLIKEFQEGAGFSNEEYEQRQREAYRELLMYQKLYDYFNENNPNNLPYEEWFEKETIDIPINKTAKPSILK